MPFLTISTSRQSISECFAAWKQNSWILAERPTSRTGIPIFESSKAWKRDSCESENRPHRAEQPIYERFQASKHESRVSSKLSPFMNTLHIFNRFAALKRDSWASTNQPHCWTALQIFQRFAPWNQYSWTTNNRPSCRMVLQLSERFENWKCFSYNQQIDQIAVRHRPYQNVLQLEKSICEY